MAASGAAAKHFWATWLAVIVCACLFGCGKPDQRIILRMGHSLDTTHPVHKAMEVMAEHLRKESQGRVQLKLYPNSQLGSEREMIELVQLGAIDLVKTSTAPLEGFVPVFAIFGIPYLFRDEEHYWSVLNGAIGQRLLEASVDKKLRGLCYYDAGSRSFYTKPRPIRDPSDLRGLKIRVQNSRTAIKLIESMGGAPTPMSFGELYSALEQGVVDGAENNPPSFLTSRHYEVCKHFTLDEHTRVPDIVLVSTERWERLAPEIQQLLVKAAEVSAEFQRKLWKEKTEETLEQLAKAGVDIIRPDKRQFQAAVQSMHASYKGGSLGTLIESILHHP